jgi:hypothetical protein
MLASTSACLGLLSWRFLVSRLSTGKWGLPITLLSDVSAGISPHTTWTAVFPFLPWLAGLLYVIGSPVDLTGGRLLFFGCAWLSAVFLAWILVKPGAWKWLGPSFLLLALVPIYLLTLGQTVGTADTFEFQVVVPKQGIVHPTGYPLYLMLTKAFTFLPVNSMAWRVNLASAIYGLAAVCLIYWLVWRLQNRPIPALLAALIFGLTPTFWSQAIEAEVYTLQALIVAAALLLMREIGDWRVSPIGHDTDQDDNLSGKKLHKQINGKDTVSHRLREFVSRPYGQTVILALVLGLGLANHLTTVILFPAAVLTIVFSYRRERYNGAPLRGIKAAALIIGAFLLPQLLYAYLPVRWLAVNGESMGIERFLDWVIGGRFQGALQLTAWINDAARYEVIGRLFEFDWQPFWLLALSLLGAVWLFARIPQYGLILFVTWLGFVFYGLNYYVPDLAVFLIPAFLVTTIWLGIGLGTLVGGLRNILAQSTRSSSESSDGRLPLGLLAAGLVGVILLAVVVKSASNRWSSIDASHDDGRTTWGRAVLSGSIEKGAAILADSDKFPPLYYLQQVEGLRTDLDILLLPDEQSYRSELQSRLDSGQDTYLARYLPGLEGIYSLGSEGPLTRVAKQPVMELPDDMRPSSVSFGPIQLLGYSIEEASPYAGDEAAVTFYWMTAEPLDEVQQVYIRLASEETIETVSGRHPANNYYPTVAWEPGEIVPDYHGLTIPMIEEATNFELQVALAPPFTPVEQLEWSTVTSMEGEPTGPSDLQPLMVQVGPNFLDGIIFPSQVRPLEEFPILVTGTGADKEGLIFELRPAGLRTGEFENEITAAPDANPGKNEKFIRAAHMLAEGEPGLYDLVVTHPGEGARCGWLSPEAGYCPVGQVEITGVPLPDSAHNFEDQIALVDIEPPDDELVPGSLIPLDLQWLALADINEDYTVFVQVLDSQDAIVGQVDSWPLQGTYPTSQWQPGEIINDPYLIQLKPELALGPYRIHVGFYLLETLQRVAVVDENGAALDDKVIISGLAVP